MRRHLRTLLALALTLPAALLGAMAASPASAAALPIGDCTTSRGVILAVDFSHWGGPVLRSCGTAGGSGDTGYQLLNEGGWSTQGDQHDGPAFICRIGYSGFRGGTMYPTPAQDACAVTPPATAYWSYWHADPGQRTWSYSGLGAMLYKPEPGSVDAWVFGATNVAGTTGGPTFSPDAVRAQNAVAAGGPPPSGGSKPVDTEGIDTGPKPVTGGGTAGATGAGSPPRAPATPRGSATRSPTPDRRSSSSATGTGAAATSSGPTAGAAPGAGAGTPSIVDAGPRAAAAHSVGSALPVVVGAALLLALAAGTGATVWRRRRSG